MSEIRPGDAGRLAFVTTRWTQVLSARGDSPEAKAALGELCEAYWLPVFRFIRRGNLSDEASRELTQEFFARLLAHDGLSMVDPTKGRFRSYLLGAVKHFLADDQDRANALKRRANQLAVPLESSPANQTTATLQVQDPTTPVPDAFFDRQWALNVLERALSEMAAELAASGKPTHFEILKPWLVGEVSELSQSEAARQLSMSEGAVKVAIHRLRKRFRALIKQEVAGTVDQPAVVQDELKYLLAALAQNG
jgi:RNA polymerase sigma-70 factor (ECF subfamily)